MIKQCLILCGGYGSRLKSITKKIPKPLIKYFGKEFLNYIIDNLENQGIKEVILLTYYKNNLFKSFAKKIKKFKKKKIKIKIICEKKKLGTGGALINSVKHQENCFFLLNGDTFFDINLREFQKISKIENNLLSIATINSINYLKRTLPNYLVKNEILKKIYYSNSKKIKKSGGIYIVNKKIIKKYINRKIIFCDFDKDIITDNLKTNKIKSIFYDKKFVDIGESFKVYKKSSKILYDIIKKPCCFLDRDGVINYDKGYTYKIKDFVFKPKVKEAIKYLNDNNYYISIVSNQSGIARGYYKINDVHLLHKYLLRQLYNFGAYIDKIYFSPFHPHGKILKYRKNSNLRKPKIGMLKLSQKELNFDKSKTFLIGDADSDIQAAKNFKIKGYLVKKNLLEQVKEIINKN